MHQPPQPAADSVHRPRAVKDTASAIVVNAEIHGAPEHVISQGQRHDHHTRDDDSFFQARIAEHAPSLARVPADVISLVPVMQDLTDKTLITEEDIRTASMGSDRKSVV